MRIGKTIKTVTSPLRKMRKATKETKIPFYAPAPDFVPQKTPQKVKSVYTST